MTQPRRVLPGSTYLLTRRCLERRFLFVPRGEVTNIFGYCLAYAAARYSIEVHCHVVLSDHWHAVVTDVNGRIPEFLRHVHSLVARALNAHLGRWESVWSCQRPSLVRLIGRDGVLRKMVYVHANAVRAGLVARGREWPGLRSTPAELLRKPRTYPRPRRFFRPDSDAPEEASLGLTVPPPFQDLSAADFVRLLQVALQAEEDRVSKQMKAEGRTFLGVRAVKRKRRTVRAKSSEQRRTLAPKVAAMDPARRLQELVELRTFRERYCQARTAWLAGDREALFPAGTYLLRLYPGVRCEPMHDQAMPRAA